MDLTTSFFRPKSTFLPLLLGVITMLLTNTLWLEFGINPRTGVIAMSCLCGLIVFSDRSLKFFVSILYFIIMSGFLYVVAIGANETLHYYFVDQLQHKERDFSFGFGKQESIKQFFDDWKK